MHMRCCSQVFAKCASGDFAFLRRKDQLNIERARGNCFENFNEGALDFPPTYKYQSGISTYCTFHSPCTVIFNPIPAQARMSMSSDQRRSFEPLLGVTESCGCLKQRML
jgi:hypothetical protein